MLPPPPPPVADDDACSERVNDWEWNQLAGSLSVSLQACNFEGFEGFACLFWL